MTRITLPVACLLFLGCHRDSTGGGPHSGGSASRTLGWPIAAASAAPSSEPMLLPGAPDVAGIASRARPAVVNITVTQEVSQQQPSELPFDFFFGPKGPHGGRPDRSLQRKALGSGFIIDDAGHVVTNAHVVANAKTVKIRLFDEREFAATVRGRDPDLDVAVLDVQGASNLPKLSLGSSEALKVGDYVVAIGNPFGLGDTVTMGIVSAKSRAIGAGPYDDFIQTDAAINPGNSGGPLLNIYDQVIGINTAINPNGQGIGFAIPIDEVKQVLPQLIENGRVRRARLGVVVQGMDAATAKALGLDRPRGALLAEIEPNGPAAAADLRPGDVILSVDGAEVRESRELPRLIAMRKPGSKVTLQVLRGGRQQTVTVELGESKPPSAQEEGEQPAPSTRGTKTPSLGVEIANTREGVTVVDVQPGSPADGQLTRGDVILEINQKPVKSVNDAMKLAEQTPHGQPTLLRIRREGHELFVGIAPNSQ